MEANVILQVVNSGIGAVTLFILSKLWDEYKAQNAFIREMLLHLQQQQQIAEQQRRIIAKEVGLTDSNMNIPIQPE